MLHPRKNSGACVRKRRADCDSPGPRSDARHVDSPGNRIRPAHRRNVAGYFVAHRLCRRRWRPAADLNDTVVVCSCRDAGGSSVRACLCEGGTNSTGDDPKDCRVASERSARLSVRHEWNDHGAGATGSCRCGRSRDLDCSHVHNTHDSLCGPSARAPPRRLHLHVEPP
jgi:hypothetical protein